ncbi:MAG: hypothetical protein ACSNEK_08060 [Parachlamydiaceae bacterium]
MLIKENLSHINRQYWTDVQSDDWPYKKLDKHLYRYIAGYSKYRSGTIFVTVCYRILQVAKAVFGCSDYQCAGRQIRHLIKNSDLRYVIYPPDQASAGAKVALAISLKLNNKGRDEPAKSEEDLYAEILTSPWLQETCRKNNLQLGLLGNIGMTALSVIGLVQRAEKFIDGL